MSCPPQENSDLDSESEQEIEEEAKPTTPTKKQPNWELTEKRKQNLRIAREKASLLRNQLRETKVKPKTKLEKRLEERKKEVIKNVVKEEVEVEPPIPIDRTSNVESSMLDNVVHEVKPTTKPNEPLRFQRMDGLFYI